MRPISFPSIRVYETDHAPQLHNGMMSFTLIEGAAVRFTLNHCVHGEAGIEDTFMALKNMKPHLPEYLHGFVDALLHIKTVLMELEFDEIIDEDTDFDALVREQQAMIKNMGSDLRTWCITDICKAAVVHYIYRAHPDLYQSMLNHEIAEELGIQIKKVHFDGVEGRFWDASNWLFEEIGHYYQLTGRLL